MALGDSFHDGGGPAPLADTDRATLNRLQRGRDWIWIAGNHDPDPADGIGGRFLATFALGALTFRHEPSEAARRRDRRPPASGRAGGAARPRGQPALLCQRRRRLVMPAFGAYTGGLNVRDRAFARVFATLAFTAHMLGDRRVYAVAAKRCLPD